MPRPAYILATVAVVLKCAPETVPTAMIIHLSEAALESGSTVEPFETLSPTVTPSLGLPRNSLTSFAAGGTKPLIFDLFSKTSDPLEGNGKSVSMR